MLASASATPTTPTSEAVWTYNNEGGMVSAKYPGDTPTSGPGRTYTYSFDGEGGHINLGNPGQGSKGCPLRSGKVKISAAASRKNAEVAAKASPMPMPGTVARAPIVYGASAPAMRPAL